jgi:hypothetical protein
MSITLPGTVTGKITDVSWEPPAELSFEQWAACAKALKGAHAAVHWWLGDWWAFGTHQYGSRARALAESGIGLDYQTLANHGWVAASVPISRRRKNLSWSHHTEVASLPLSQQRKWLDRAEHETMTVRQLHAALAHQREATLPVDDRRAAEAVGFAAEPNAIEASSIGEHDAAAEESEQLAGEPAVSAVAAEHGEPPDPGTEQALALYHRGIGALVSIAQLPSQVFIADDSVQQFKLRMVRDLCNDVLAARGGKAVIIVDAEAANVDDQTANATMGGDHGTR